MESNFTKYLHKLGISKKAPDYGFLREIISSQLSCIPFENISKIYYHDKFGDTNIPNFDLFVEGIQTNNFGGTCYTTNYYLHLLLKYLGYDVILCGADMNEPDVHIVNIVHLAGSLYLVDAGYAAPFLEPIPLDLTVPFEIKLGRNKYILMPVNQYGRHEMQFYRDGILSHGYTIKPYPRQISDFASVIAKSYDSTATFFNELVMTKMCAGTWVRLDNNVLSEYSNGNLVLHTLNGVEQIAAEIERHFSIKAQIAADVIQTLPLFRDN